MGSRNKLKKFNENIQANNIVEEGKPLFDSIKGNWNELMFKNKQPIVLELGCGYGEYSVGLGQVFPYKNFIGTDIKGARIWRGAKQATEADLSNVAFLRTGILYISDFFAENEVDEIWVTFPDPRPKSKDERKRLISPRFLLLYSTILKNNGIVHLKTDNTFLYEYAVELIHKLGLEVLIETNDLYQNDELMADHHGLKTRYEKIFTEKGEKIKYLRFKLNREILLEKIPDWKNFE